MEWIEIKVTTKSESVDFITNILTSFGVTGFIIEDDLDMQNFFNNFEKTWDYVDENLLKQVNEDAYIKFYLSKVPLSNEILINIQKEFSKIKNEDYGFDLENLEMETNLVDDEDWINTWKKHYKPFEIGEKILIKPVWEEVENLENRIIFNSDPGHVFGTGLHQSTQLCIIELEKYVNNESVILDLGCGSGILSIISLLLGGKESYAIDIEEDAVNVAYKNADLNNIDKSKYKVFSGNILEDETVKKQIDKNFNLIIANIVADVIIDFKDYVYEKLLPNGIFICSGIIDTRFLDVKNALEQSNFEIISKNEKDNWVSITAKKI